MAHQLMGSDGRATQVLKDAITDGVKKFLQSEAGKALLASVLKALKPSKPAKPSPADGEPASE